MIRIVLSIVVPLVLPTVLYFAYAWFVVKRARARDPDAAPPEIDVPWWGLAMAGLVLVAVSKYLGKLAKDGVRIRIVGDRSAVSDKLREAWEQAESVTRDNTRITLAVAFNYGGRWDMVQAARQAIAEGVAPEQLDEAWLSRHMALSFAPDPDLFIRTGGEQRISNFLLWQLAYTELYFTDTLWPDFDSAALDLAIRSYQKRERRFGRTSEQLKAGKEPMRRPAAAESEADSDAVRQDA